MSLVRQQGRCIRSQILEKCLYHSATIGLAYVIVLSLSSSFHPEHAGIPQDKLQGLAEEAYFARFIWQN